MFEQSSQGPNEKSAHGKSEQAAPPDDKESPEVNVVWQSLALHRKGIQPKLAVSQPHDHSEQEADRIAERVMRKDAPEGGQSKPASESMLDEIQRKAVEGEEEDEEEEEKKINRKEDLNRPGSDQLPAADTSSELTGQPLEAATLAFMGSRFGQDFSQVRVQTDDRAAESAKAVNALAYTVGNRIVFGRGQYSPHSDSGKKLLAHELAHVVQQGGPSSANQTASAGSDRPHVQRKIIVGGKDYTPTATYLKWLEAKYSKRMVEFINSMHNAGKPPDYIFSSFEEMGQEVRMRHFIIEGIGEVHQPGTCSYPTGGGDGQLDPTYWDKLGPFQFKVKSPLPAGKDASDAIEAIFKVGAGTELECNSTTVAIQYRAMLKTLGPKAFNKKFPSGAGIIISPHHTPPTGHSPHPIWDKNLYKQVTITGAADLLPGDWVYFKNVADYSAKHPGEFWTGEHCLYLGGGKFRGFGIAELSEGDINAELLREYNSGLAAADKKTLADVPGLQKYARRPIIQEILK
jgi:hypothetical protein